MSFPQLRIVASLLSHLSRQSGRRPRVLPYTEPLEPRVMLSGTPPGPLPPGPSGHVLQLAPEHMRQHDLGKISVIYDVAHADSGVERLLSAFRELDARPTRDRPVDT